MNHAKRRQSPGWTGLVVMLSLAVGLAGAAADEAPISGAVKTVDPQARSLTLQVTARGRTREVTVHLRPGARVVRFARATDPGRAGFVEQEVALADVRPGWIVSVATTHEGDREVADLVKVVLER